MTKAPPPLGTGIPTYEELEYYYPPMFSWDEVKAQVDSGDLGNLKRNPILQVRYDKWRAEQEARHGNIINYLVNVRLGWGPTHTRPPTPAQSTYTDDQGSSSDPASDLPTPPPTRPFTPSAGSEPAYFTADIPPKYVKILPNDWPYSIPLDVKHFAFWTRVPIIHPSIVPSTIWKRIENDGLWGFTGSGRKAEPKVQGESEEIAELVKKAHEEVHKFVFENWPEGEYETAWFVNPPRLQSIPGLAHGHVFARLKKQPLHL